MKRVDGVVLAAGPSRRFRAAAATEPAAGGAAPVKQLLRFGGESLVRRAVRAALGSRLTRVLVVVGCQAQAVAAELADLPVEIADNPAFEGGQSTSVRAALGHLSAAAEAALFIPCDQPLLGSATLDLVLATWEQTGADIVVPVFEAQRGAPVLFARALFDALGTIEGDAGGRQLFSTHSGSIAEAQLSDAWPLRDIDTPADYRQLLSRLG